MVNSDIIEEVFTGPAMVMHAQDVKERRLTRSGGPHDRDKLAFLNLQIDVAEDIKESPLGQGVTAFNVAESDHNI